MCCVKHNIMLFIIVLFCLIVVSDAQTEGQRCSKDGRNGFCTILSKCLTAVEEIRQKKRPKTCGFIGSDPIVCCFDYEGNEAPGSLQIPDFSNNKRPVSFSETLDNRVGVLTGCAPIPADWTQGRTGQKAFDKCIEYQEQFVYPCQKSVTLTEDNFRGYHCYHDDETQFDGVTSTTKYEFSHVAMLGNGTDEWPCSGTVISDRFILTAAHCQPLALYAVVGPINRLDTNNPSKLYKVENFITHPEYKPLETSHLALAKTDRPMKLSQFLVPACLDLGGPFNDSKVLTVVWGDKAQGRKVANSIQKVILEKLSIDDCLNRYPAQDWSVGGLNAQTQGCYASRSQSVCQGDSGNAIMRKSKLLHCMYVVVGVSSYGKICDDLNLPGIYTRVVTYLPWIESIVWP